MLSSPPLRLSISQVRLFTACSYAWFLRYRRGHLPATGAGAFGGAISHQTIQLAYGGLTLAQAHQQVWSEACAPLLDTLEDLIALDAAYAAAGKPQSKAAREWRERTPRYDAALRAIADYQMTVLGHLRWGERQSLAALYRRAVVLRDTPPEDVLLADPILVEGKRTTTLRDTPLSLDASAEETEATDYTPLSGILGTTQVAGVPDVVAPATISEGGMDVAVMRVGDYKTSRPVSSIALAEDPQLALYVALLRQSGIITAEQRVQVGHITISEDGVQQCWVETTQHERVLSRLERQFAHAVALMEAEVISPAKGIAAFMSPCSFCDMAHICDD